MNNLEISTKYQNQKSDGQQLFMMNGSTSGPSAASNNGEAINGTANTVASSVPTSTSEINSENRRKKADVRLSSVADAEDDDSNNGYGRRSGRSSCRRSSCSTRKSINSLTSLPEDTPDPLGPVARYSSSFTMEDIDLLSSSRTNLSVPPDVVNEIIRATEVDIGETGELVSQQHSALYDPPHTSYIPTSKSSGPKKVAIARPQEYHHHYHQSAANIAMVVVALHSTWKTRTPQFSSLMLRDIVLRQI